MLSLNGKVAVVTGSGLGLGRAYAVGLAKAGAKVVVNATTLEHVANTVEEIRKDGGTAESCAVSVASMEGARQIIETALEKFGRIDILVNNAGIVRMKALADMTEQDFDEVVAVNLKGTFACTRLAVSYMIRQKWGRIINMASGAALGRYEMTSYAASKAGVIAMTTTWAEELAGYGITCNAIRAGARTRMTEPLIEKAREDALEKGGKAPSAIELGYYKPALAAPLVVFLASDEAHWINGQFIGINGPYLSIWAYIKPAATVIVPEGWTVGLMVEHFKTKLGRQLQKYGTHYPRDVS